MLSVNVENGIIKRKKKGFSAEELDDYYERGEIRKILYKR